MVWNMGNVMWLEQDAKANTPPLQTPQAARACGNISSMTCGAQLGRRSREVRDSKRTSRAQQPLTANWQHLSTTSLNKVGVPTTHANQKYHRRMQYYQAS
jgi:hypothetical protein